MTAKPRPSSSTVRRPEDGTDRSDGERAEPKVIKPPRTPPRPTPR